MAPRTLYHYCSIETFANILKNKSIWLSDIQQSNDYLELEYMKSFFAKKIWEATRDFISNHIEKGLEYNSNELIALSEVFTNSSLLEISKTWGFCLSEKGDLLSQWRGYADDGSGVSIGFNRNYLSMGLSSINEVLTTKQAETSGIIRLQKVDYSDKHMKNSVNEFFDSLACGKSETIEEYKSQIHNSIFYVDIGAAYYKHKSFAEECEWRIALNTLIDNKCSYHTINIDSETVSLGNFGYISSNKKLMSHFELKINDMRKAINCIILGPKCKVQKSEMQHYLITLGILKNLDDNSIKILSSSSSYR